MRRLLPANTLLCFSPAVMVITIIIELALAVWVLLRYGCDRPRRLILALLVLLAAFQFAEYNVCGSPSPTLLWSRFGYVCITLLPALGLHLASLLRGGRARGLVIAGYALAIAFAATFAGAPVIVNTPVCTGNYVIFNLAQPLSQWYAFYYFGLEAAGLVVALQPIKRATNRLAARWLALAYGCIMLPTLVLFMVLPSTRAAVPSIMCGFAVLYALIIGLRVAPLAATSPVRSK